MRSLLTLNICALAFSFLSIFLGFFRQPRGQQPSWRHEKFLFWVIFAVAVFLRAYQFPYIPAGFNQDEASMAYDAYATMFFGMDRNGTHFPAYAISWGSGQNVLLMYIIMPFLRILGMTVFAVRLPTLILGILTPVITFFLVKRFTKPEPSSLAIVTMLLTAISPWHIMLSRWALESNALPFMFLLAVYLLVIAIQEKRTLLFCLSAVVFALSMYAYATVCIVMPIFLILLTILLVKLRTTAKQLLLAAASFMIISIPIACFYIVNIFKLDAIVTLFFTAPRLTKIPGVFNPNHILYNAKLFLGLLITQNDKFLHNSIPQFGFIYMFMVPFVIIGIYSALKNKIVSERSIMILWLFSAIILGLMIKVNINRINIIFIPLIYFAAKGVIWVANRYRGVEFIIIFLVLSACQFSNTYFGQDYACNIGEQFFSSYGEAIQFANERSGLNTIIYTPDVPYTLALFYAKTDPRIFTDTVVYENQNVEFRQVISFDRYCCLAPETLNMDNVYIFPNNYENQYDFSGFAIKHFKNFIVAYKYE